MNAANSAEVGSMPRAELERIESNPQTSAELWKAAVAELARRDRGGGVVEYSAAAPSPAKRRSDDLVVIARPVAHGFTCPRCGSDNTKRVSLVHAEGTTRIAGVSTGVGYSAHGGAFVEGGQFGGVAVTDLSAKLGPPASRSVGWAFFLMVFAWWAVFVSLARVNGFLAFVAAGGVAVWIYLQMSKKARDWNNHVLPIALSEWRRKLLCQRCGEVYVGPD